jgi:hypothetical protein
MKRTDVLKRSIAACLSVVLFHAAFSAEPTLDRLQLKRQLPGNTIRYEAPGEVIHEFLALDGTIHGQSSVHGRYRGHWRLHENDLFCFEHDDPMQSGCVAVVLRGSQIEYHRRDGIVEGPFEFIAGNPEYL